MNGEDTYLTVEKPAEGSYKDKGSRFLAFIHPIQSENEVKDILSSLKTKYHDARHPCYAYALGLHRDTFRAVDDGEPSSTAGKPILGQIIANNLTNVLIVVVRYFGGIKLGVPGLIQAYRQASADAISNASIIQRTEDITLHLQFPYTAINDVMKILKDMNPNILSRQFEIECQLTLSIRRNQSQTIRQRLSQIESLTINP